MNLKKIILPFILSLQLYACADYKTVKITQDKEKHYFLSSGFALVYEDNLYVQKVVNRKLNNDDIVVMHNLLNKNTPIKIINPENSKVVETKIFRKANYPMIFNIVLSKKIATILELDIDNPYVEVFEIKKNKTFIAKEGNIFEEEKTVVETAPVDEVEIDDLSEDKSNNEKKITKKNFFILIISDFYYYNSANNLKNELVKKTHINKFSIQKINDNKYRLSVGPFKNFNALKSIYISLNKLGFEDLNIYRE